MSCNGACPDCCDNGSGMRFWYGYLARAISFMDEPHSVSEIYREAIDGGAPEEITHLFEALMRTIRTCRCAEICWCETIAHKTLDPFSPADVAFTTAWYDETVPPDGVCWCGQGVNAADTDELDAHIYCHPGM